MNIEKRDAGAPVTPPSAPETAPAHSKKPVIIYIMIMFIVAFLLMAMSFVMHQRSNSEALGELQNSVNAMQAVQATQEKIIDLQEELSLAEDEIDRLNQELEGQIQESETAASVTEAMLHLYFLQQAYANQDYDACKTFIREMEEKNLVELLPQNRRSDTTPPYERFAELKDAVLSK